MHRSVTSVWRTKQGSTKGKQDNPTVLYPQQIDWGKELLNYQEGETALLSLQIATMNAIQQSTRRKLRQQGFIV